MEMKVSQAPSVTTSADAEEWLARRAKVGHVTDIPHAACSISQLYDMENNPKP